MRLIRVHFILGLAFLTHFVITGWLLKINYFEVDRADIAMRMMFRANHIYILFTALAHLLMHAALTRRLCSIITEAGGLIMLLASCVINVAFYMEPAKDTLQRPITGYALIAMLAGIAINLLYFQFSKQIK